MGSRIRQGVALIGIFAQALQGQRPPAPRGIGTVELTNPQQPNKRFRIHVKLPIRTVRELSSVEDWNPDSPQPDPGLSRLYVDGPRRFELIVDGYACYPRRTHVQFQIGKAKHEGYIGGCVATPIKVDR